MLLARAAGRSLRAIDLHCSLKVYASTTPYCMKRSLSISHPLLYATNKSSPGEEGDDVLPGSTSLSEGSFARTDEQVKILHPDEQHMPRSAAGAGRSGLHLKPTLASFSLEGRVAVITGGARGLGLVMAQALIVSGADVAIVDLNSKQDCHCIGRLYFTLILSQRKRETGRRRSWWIGFEKKILTPTSISHI